MDEMCVRQLVVDRACAPTTRNDLAISTCERPRAWMKVAGVYFGANAAVPCVTDT